MADPALNGLANCDDSFGPAAANCSSPRFDLTIKFEQSILTIAPCTLLLICALPRIVQLLRESPKVVRFSLGRLKSAIYTLFIALQLALLVLWSKNYWLANSISITAAIFTLVDAVALAALSHLEHQRSARPSTIILAYLIFSIAFDSIQCRTLWLVRADAVAPVYTATLGIKTLAFLLELKEKRNILLPPWNQLSPEMTGSIINRSLFWWLNDLLIQGFRATLSGFSLYDTDAALKSRRLLGKIQTARKMWSAPKLGFCRRNKLLFSLLDSIRGPLLLAVFPRLCWIGFKFAQPFLLNRVVSYITNEKGSDPQKSTGFALVGATALVYLGIAISKGSYQHQLFRFLTMVRGALISLVYIQTLAATAISATSDGQSTASNSAALTLIGPDVTAISGALEAFHEIWANPIEIILAIWLLSREIGPGSVGPAVAVLVCTFTMTKLSKRMGPAMKSWNIAIQARISTTSGILRHIKELKMLGMISCWMSSIQALRITELNRSQKFRTLIAYMNMLGNTPTALSPIVTFGIAIAVQSKSGQHFTVTTAFTSLSIIGLIVAPLSHLLYAVPSFFSCLGSFERIEAFANKNNTGILSISHPSNSHSSNDIELLATTPQHKVQAIRATNVSFHVTGQREPVLKNLQFAIAPYTFTVITGKVGSGKSMLLLGILGELKATGDFQGSFPGVSYCSQQPWLIKAPIKQNITGPEGSDVDDTWYHTVVEACALTRDFQQLPLGDNTNALTLSGGQKQRVALARAIYARNPVLVADDVFSGLDPETRHHVWIHVFSPAGVLRRLRTTVILVAHTLEYLRDADQIIILENGEIIHQGSYSIVSEIASLLVGQGKIRPVPSHSLSETSGQGPITVKSEPKDQDKQEAEDLARTGDSALYLFYFQSIGWKHALMVIFLGMLPVFLQQFTQIWLKWWTEANNGSSQTNTGIYYGTYCALLCPFILTTGLDCWFMFVKVIPRSATWLHWKLLETTLKASLAFFHRTDSGDLVNRFSQDMTLVDRELPTAAYTTHAAILSCIGEFVLIVLGAKYLAATLPITLIILYSLQKFYLSTSRQLRILDLQAKAPLYKQLLEIIEGLTTIRAFCWQEAISQQSLELLDLSQRPHYLLLSIQRWLTLVLDLLVTVSAVLLVLFAVATNSTSPGYMAVAMYSVMGFSESLSNLLTSWTALETSLGAITRLREFVKATPQEIEPASDDRDELPPSWPSHGRIEWRNVEATYQIAGEERVPVLRDISLTIDPGQKVAICGRTGSGKSSFISTLFKLVDYTGIIKVDTLDIANISNEELRASLIIVSQNPTLFPGTLRSNLALPNHNATPPSNEEVITVLESLKVWAAIQKSGSLDTEVENLSLSIGQQQLICLARAILQKKDSNILILDEAMSAVDGETEKLMVTALETEFADHTVLSIVHRLDTVRKYDRLVVLDAGRIIDIGSPKDMIDRNGRLVRRTSGIR
ncbi:abc transporter [Trichoderma arundinaceum]|uniref:Abc transporter n=1 Tax=Trichoderma arundinaceum TaxID=490622 RepID=A0A395NMP6_TRIAR|nr:abc transporter [Trichoderma arundinaceum]